MIDLHCHLLPDLDDGPATVDASLDLARGLAAAGTKAVVATPHVNADYPGSTALTIANGVLLLRRRLKEEGIGLRVLRGAEVALDHGLELPPAELDRLRLGGRGWLLLEAPHGEAGDGVEVMLEATADRVDRVLLAHPERIATFQRDPDLLERLVRDGMRCQLTASSLSGRFGSTVRRFSEELLDRGLVHCVASDAHGIGRRGPELRTTLEEVGLTPAEITWLCSTVPTAVIAGVAVLPPGPAPEDLPAWRRRRMRKAGR